MNTLIGVLMAMSVAYMIGYNTGFNNGHDNALKYEDACKPHVCEYYP